MKKFILNKEYTCLCFDPTCHEEITLEDAITDPVFYLNTGRIIDGTIKSGCYILDNTYYKTRDTIIDQGSELVVDGDNFVIYLDGDPNRPFEANAVDALTFMNYWAGLM